MQKNLENNVKIWTDYKTSILYRNISQISCFVKNGLDIDINLVYFITKELFLDFEF